MANTDRKNEETGIAHDYLHRLAFGPEPENILLVKKIF